MLAQRALLAVSMTTDLKASLSSPGQLAALPSRYRLIYWSLLGGILLSTKRQTNNSGRDSECGKEEK